MKMNKLITTAAVTLMVLGVVSTSASANVVAGANDLILGFQATDASINGNNTGTALTIDLGAISSFTTTTATVTIAGLKGADLSSIYGAGWATRTDLLWSAAGKSTTAGSFLATANANAAPYETSSNSIALGYITALAQGLNGQAQTATSSTLAVTTTTGAAVGTSSNPASGILKSYIVDLNGDGTADFGIQSLNPGDAQSLGGPIGTLELYRFDQALGFPSPIDLGTFSLTGSGSNATLTFTGINAAAVPEPSTYVLGLSGLLLLWMIKRRKSLI